LLFFLGLATGVFLLNYKLEFGQDFSPAHQAKTITDMSKGLKAPFCFNCPFRQRHIVTKVLTQLSSNIGHADEKAVNFEFHEGLLRQQNRLQVTAGLQYLSASKQCEKKSSKGTKNLIYCVFQLV
jgi:hypothetical protein